MGPIWPSYYGDCRSVLFVVDASNPAQLSASSAQLLGLLAAERLAGASVLILFNKISDLPCYMTVEEMKSLLRLPDIVAHASQNISTAEISARDGTGLSGVLHWLQGPGRTHASHRGVTHASGSGQHCWPPAVVTSTGAGVGPGRGF
ncbi:PREDICTED: ADP-ribosylation factor-like protein 16 [Condylura cristata]|uniref:ADP-ribosylation factor-like protein 16 n=1 Tax=Condylura cristata TaxID=143302 RepID=UPI000643B6AF|nr:PREDICTED: ADP-ribosylation factor-like protein 16 [Condylura cristata]